MRPLTLDFFKEKQLDLRAEWVDVPEFGDDVGAFIAQMSADEQYRRHGLPWINRKARLKQEDDEGFHAFAVAACMCDAERVFASKTEEETNALADYLIPRPAKGVRRMFDVADKLNGITSTEVEAIAKN